MSIPFHLYLKFFLVFLIPAMLGLISACKPPADKKNKPPVIEHALKDPLIKANRHILESEDALIDDFMKRYNWNMQKTEQGLRYLIYVKGNGKPVQPGDKVTLKFETKLLDGSICYTSEIQGPKIFVQGAAQVEKGLDDGILLLRVGDQAKFILPSHLAFGLLGDQLKIPARSAIIYDLEVVSSLPTTP